MSPFRWRFAIRHPKRCLKNDGIIHLLYCDVSRQHLPTGPTVTKLFRYLKWRNPHLYKLYGYGLCKGVGPTPENSLLRFRKPSNFRYLKFLVIVLILQKSRFTTLWFFFTFFHVPRGPSFCTETCGGRGAIFQGYHRRLVQVKDMNTWSFQVKYVKKDTLPETNIALENRPGPKGTFIFQPSISGVIC